MSTAVGKNATPPAPSNLFFIQYSLFSILFSPTAAGKNVPP